MYVMLNRLCLSLTLNTERYQVGVEEGLVLVGPTVRVRERVEQQLSDLDTLLPWQGSGYV